MIDVNSTVKPLWTVSDHSLGITDLAINTGSIIYSFIWLIVYLFSCSLDKTIRIWNLYAHRCVSTISTPDAVHCVWLGLSIHSSFFSHMMKRSVMEVHRMVLFMLWIFLFLFKPALLQVVKEKTQYRFNQLIPPPSQGKAFKWIHLSLSMTITGDNKNLITGSKDGSIYVIHKIRRII